MPAFDLPLEELYHYRGISPRPKDFDHYWLTALAELDTAEPDVKLQPASFTASGTECFDLVFSGVREAKIYAKYLRPAQVKSCPCVLFFHGYNMSSGDWVPYLPYVLQGMCVVAMDCRGQGGRSEDTGRYTGNTKHGHIIRGIMDDPQDLLFRQIYLDTVQLVRILNTFPEIDPLRIAAIGASQGGALAAACSALSGGVKLSVIQHPFLADFKRTWQMDLGGKAYEEIYQYFRMFDPMHQQEEQFFERLGYLDIRLLAERIHNHTLMAIGLMDQTCVPSTQFAVYNALAGEKELCLYPDFAHEHFPGFADRVFSFLKQL